MHNKQSWAIPWLPQSQLQSQVGISARIQLGKSRRASFCVAPVVLFSCHHASVFIIIYKLCSILHCWFFPPSFMPFFFASQRCLFYMSFFMMSESLFFNDHVHCAFSVKEIQVYYFCNGKTLNWVCRIWWINQSTK